MLHLRSPLLAFLVAATAAGCAPDAGVARTHHAISGACGLGDEFISNTVLTTASIPDLSEVLAAQIVAAVQESAHTDVTTVEEAFDRVDEHEMNVRIYRDSAQNRFYVEIEYGAGGNSYGAIFYWGTAVKGGAIHDGFPEECGPSYYNYDQGDVAPECAGLLDYANTATFAELDAYLPSNVAQNLVDARGVQPFDSIASLVAVSGVAETRLQQLLAAARAASFVGADCDGVHDQIGVSTDEAAAMVALVNSASAEELHGVLRYLIDETVVDHLLADRPYAGADELAATYRVGPATFRTLRNAATFQGPFEELVAEVNEVNRPDAQVRVYTHFEWLPLVTSPDYGLTDMTCFGIDPLLLPAGATDRGTLADGDEVLDDVTDAVATVAAQLDIDPAAGLADLGGRVDGQSFFGCYISYHPNPWQYDYQTFFVDTETGFGVLHTFHYVE